MEESSLWPRLMQQLRESCATFDDLWIERRRVFDTETMVRGLLHLACGGHQSYQRVMDQLDLALPPAASSFCEARAKFPSFIIGELRRDLLDIWDDHVVPDRRWHGYRPYAVDGTRVSLPRGLFEYGFKAPHGGHCPQALVSLLVRLDDRIVCDVRLAKHENERNEAYEHLAHLSDGDVVLYDRGYTSFALLTAHKQHKVEAVIRMTRGASFLPVEKFWRSRKLEAIITINPTPKPYASARKMCPDYVPVPIQLRLIKYRIADETYVLATTILGGDIPRQAFVELYSQRWWAEETFKSYKVTLDLETFHSRSEAGIRQEVEAATLLWNLTRMLSAMTEPAIKKTVPLPQFITLPSQLSAGSLEGCAQPQRTFFRRNKAHGRTAKYRRVSDSHGSTG